MSESYLNEQQYIEKQKTKTAAASRSRKEETQVRLSIIRCNKLKGDDAMAACNEGLAVIPDHPDLLTGRGNVWLAMDRFGNAIRDFEAALAADPKNREAAKNLRLAQTKRDVKVAQCLQADGLDGLKACDAALLKGASDEFAVQKRRARLLQAMGREKEAIEAYRVAAGLNPADGQIKQSLAALSPQGEKPPTRQAPAPAPAAPPEPEPASAPAPAAGDPNDGPALDPPSPVEQPARARPAAPASTSVEVAVATPEPPVQSSLAKAPDPPEVEPRKPAPVEAASPVSTAAPHRRRYSNAPEVPGITH